MALLSPRLWGIAALVAALAFSHIFMYRKGVTSAETKCALATAEANNEARRIEAKRQSIVDAAGVAATKRQRALVDSARDAAASADGLRDALDATERFAAQSRDAAAKAVAALRAISESCSAEYRAMGEAAQGHADDVKTLTESWPQ